MTWEQFAREFAASAYGMDDLTDEQVATIVAWLRRRAPGPARVQSHPTNRRTNPGGPLMTAPGFAVHYREGDS